MGQRGVEVSIVVRVYDPEKDLSAIETVDRLCDGGATGQVSLCMDLLGDPASRVRHSPAYRMLVPAEAELPFLSIVSACVLVILVINFYQCNR